jgi:hypothetical protein
MFPSCLSSEDYVSSVGEKWHVLLAFVAGCVHERPVISGVKLFKQFILTNSSCFVLSVMTMESQAEALGQLGADDLEGKVKLYSAY